MSRALDRQPRLVWTHRFSGESLAGLKPYGINRRGIARTFQNIRLFAGMTVLENLLVAQHNTLMAATGFGLNEWRD